MVQQTPFKDGLPISLHECYSPIQGGKILLRKWKLNDQVKKRNLLDNHLIKKW